jgi:hypothetical protein
VTAGRRQLVMILLGVAVLVLGIVVAIRNNGADDELLAAAAMVGGLAIVLNAIPAEGST